MLFTSGSFVVLSILQPEHMIFILLVVLLLFGGKKIPELMRGLGRGVREFNDAKDNVKRELEEGLKDQTTTPKQVVNSAATATKE